MNNPKNSLPNGWSLKKLGEIINYKKGFAFKSVDYQQNGVRIVRISDTTSDSIKEDGKIFIDYKKAENYIEYRLEENDIIVATVGSRPPMYDSMVGKAILVRKEFVGSLLNQNAVKLIPIQDYDSRVIYEHLRMPTYINYIEDLVRGNANQVSITLNDLFAFEIPLPPLPEQQKITTILGTWDAAIQTTTALLTALQKRKKGLMQQLLSPKSDWKEVRLGECFERVTNGFNYDITIKQGLPVTRIETISSGRIDFNKVGYTTSFNKMADYELRKGDILYSHINSLDHIGKIAAILNAADAELRQTEVYLEKLKTQKRGLMQQLLTGKVRVTTT